RVACVVFFFKQKTADEVFTSLEFRRVLFRSVDDRINLFNEILTSLELGFSQENIEFANLSLNSLLASFFYVETYRASKGYQSKKDRKSVVRESACISMGAGSLREDHSRAPHT